MTKLPSENDLGHWNRKIDEILRMDRLTDNQKVSRIRNLCSVACATTAIQPIPFADIFILTPIQAVFAAKIASIRGVPVNKEDAGELMKQLAGMAGMGILAQNIAIGIWKIVAPGLGSFLTWPMVFALTYAIMTAADGYYKARAAGKTLTPEELEAIVKKAKAEGKEEAKKHKPGEENPS